jgi:predicted hydrocarbon binding protein
MIEFPEDIDIKMEEMPIEKRYKSVTAGLIRRIKILYDAIYEKYGEDGLDLIRDVGRKYGQEIAQRAKERVKPDDLKSVALYIIRIFNTLRGNGKVVEFSDKRVVIRVWECPYPWETPEVCEAHTRMEKTLVETLGKNLCYRISKSIPKGDPYCDHIIEKRKTNGYGA